MANIRITALPADTSPNAADVVPIDGSTTRKTTLTNLVNAGRPFASQAEAEAGTLATKGMSPLTTAQAIAAIGGAAFAATGRGLPIGGSANQVLAKVDGTNYNVAWSNAGSGNVVGPGSSTDSHLAAFDTTTGRLLKDSGIALSAVANPPYDVMVFFSGVPANSLLMSRIVTPRAVTFPTGLSGSYASATVAATASTVLTIKQNGSSIGTITFASSATTGTFTFASPVTTAAGDVITVTNQASADATLANISITLVGSR